MVDTVNPQPCPSECWVHPAQGPLCPASEVPIGHPRLTRVFCLKQPRHFDATRSVC